MMPANLAIMKAADFERSVRHVQCSPAVFLVHFQRQRDCNNLTYDPIDNMFHSV